MIASKRTQSLLDFRHIIPSHMALPPQMRSKTPITDLDAPDAATQSMSHLTSAAAAAAAAAAENQSASMNNHNNNNQNNSNRKTSIPTVQNKNFHSGHMDEEKHSIAGDPIYQTISSEKGAKLGRNCISLENLRTLTIKNDLNSYGNNLLQNQNGNPSSPYYILPTFPPNPSYHASHYFPHKPNPFMYGPAIPQHPFPMQPVHHMMAHQPATYFHNYRAPFTNYGGYTNPNP